MKKVNGFLQIIAVQMNINFCGQDGLMAEHLLNGAQVGPSVNQVRGKRVPESVRTDLLLQIHLSSQVFDNGENHHPAELISPPVQKHNVFASGLNL